MKPRIRIQIHSHHMPPSVPPSIRQSEGSYPHTLASTLPCPGTRDTSWRIFVFFFLPSKNGNLDFHPRNASCLFSVTNFWVWKCFENALNQQFGSVMICCHEKNVSSPGIPSMLRGSAFVVKSPGFVWETSNHRFPNYAYQNNLERYKYKYIYMHIIISK